MSNPAIEKPVRLFFALWPDAAERAAVSAWQPDLHKLCGGRCMRSDRLHVTLVFLGNVEMYRLEALQLVAREVDGEPFNLIFDVARYWAHNHIVYAAPTILPPPLEQLVDTLEQRLSQHRFHFDRHPYKPHVTLLRKAQWNEARLPAMDSVVWQVRRFVLVQSAADNQGANYRALAEFPLR